MKRARSIFALMPLALLASCNAPSEATVTIVNNSGRAIWFESCQHRRIDLAPGAQAVLVDVYRAIAPKLAWYCYRKQPFVVSTDRGEWRYKLWLHRDVGASDGTSEAVIDFAGKPNDFINGKTFPRHVLIPIAIESDGSLRAGRNLPAPSYTSSYEAEFPTDVQPRGFPIRPL